MANYEQVKPFYPKEMGSAKGWCLKNCRLGFRIYTAKYASAKAAMQAAKKNGTLHSLSELPSNIAVPVYLDTPSQYEHVVVYDKGVWYEDGKKVSKPKYSSFGWDEMMDGTRVVKKVTTTGFLPAKGYWSLGDADARIGKLSAFMRKTFPAYTSKNVLNNPTYYSKDLKKAITEFQKRTGLYPDGITGKNTYAKLQKYGFKA